MSHQSNTESPKMPEMPIISEKPEDAKPPSSGIKDSLNLNFSELKIGSENLVPVLTLIPNEILKLIPMFDGDKRTLNLYLKKGDYVVTNFAGDINNQTQQQYVLHALTSRLSGKAAALVSENEHIAKWPELKNLMLQHFGDTRTEDCILMELESVTLKPNESFLELCNRIQLIRSNLFAKINEASDITIKNSRMQIYNHSALNVFLYNLPKGLMRIVRLKKPSTLEDALQIVLEEVNFNDQYKTRNNTHKSTSPKKTQNNAPRPFVRNFNYNTQYSRPNWQKSNFQNKPNNYPNRPFNQSNSNQNIRYQTNHQPRPSYQNNRQVMPNFRPTTSNSNSSMPRNNLNANTNLNRVNSESASYSDSYQPNAGQNFRVRASSTNNV